MTNFNCYNATFLLLLFAKEIIFIVTYHEHWNTNCDTVAMVISAETRCNQGDAVKGDIITVVILINIIVIKKLKKSNICGLIQSTG